MKTTNRKIMKTLFLVGFKACMGGMTINQAKKWFNKTYPKSEDQPKKIFQTSDEYYKIKPVKNCQ